jgi:dimethylhistidine N-methyltransferase
MSDEDLDLHDLEPATERVREDVLSGLRTPPYSLPCKYLYDERGSELFEQICDLDEYYPTRTELSIMRRWVAEMAKRLGPLCMIVEYGSGSSVKTRVLLEALDDPVAYVPVDISRDFLLRSAGSLDRCHPDLEVLPVCADFTESFALPLAKKPAKRRVVYFPGSTIGNFDPPDVVKFLTQVRRQCGPYGGLLIGVDLPKDRTILEAAYDDARGVTADFNLNLLQRLNRELSANFDLAGWAHRAVYDPEHGRVEMHLVSQRAQQVRIGDETLHFEAGEWIHTESSYKYDKERFAGFAAEAGLAVRDLWTDEDGLFSVQYLTPA